MYNTGMPKRVTVQTELTTEELHARYRSTPHPVERTHWHILWLLKDGHTPDEIASILGSTARWVRTIVQRWNRAGSQAFGTGGSRCQEPLACSPTSTSRNWIMS